MRATVVQASSGGREGSLGGWGAAAGVRKGGSESKQLGLLSRTPVAEAQRARFPLCPLHTPPSAPFTHPSRWTARATASAWRSSSRCAAAARAPHTSPHSSGGHLAGGACCSGGACMLAFMLDRHRSYSRIPAAMLSLSSTSMCVCPSLPRSDLEAAPVSGDAPDVDWASAFRLGSIGARWFPGQQCPHSPLSPLAAVLFSCACQPPCPPNAGLAHPPPPIPHITTTAQSPGRCTPPRSMACCWTWRRTQMWWAWRRGTR